MNKMMLNQEELESVNGGNWIEDAQNWIGDHLPKLADIREDLEESFKGLRLKDLWPF